MITPRQRKYLKSLANTLDVKIIIGKNSLTSSVIDAIGQALDANEIVKIKVLNNNLDDQNILVEQILSKLNCEFVSHLGSKIVIYRQSEKKIIEFPS